MEVGFANGQQISYEKMWQMQHVEILKSQLAIVQLIVIIIYCTVNPENRDAARGSFLKAVN